MPSQPRTRRRQLPGPTVNARSVQVHDSGIVNSVVDPTRKWNGIQITESEGHQWPPPSKGQLTDHGGPFYTTKAFVASPATMPVTTLGPELMEGSYTWRETYIGPLLAFPAVSYYTDGLFEHLPPDESLTDDNLAEKGTTAIARCEPTNSVADLSTALSELIREGLPSMIGQQTWKSRAKDARKSAGGEYLNVQFGLRPLLSEIGDFAKAVRNADRILAQYERDAGKVVRRRYYFPSETSTVVSEVPNPYMSFNAGQHAMLAKSKYQGKTTRTRKTVQKVWFSGAFTYHLPVDYDSRRKVSEYAAKAEKLFGLEFSLETLWNISPWSWAVDWFANTGDVIHNLEAFKTNGLILRYGYVMCETITTDTYTFAFNSNSSGLPRVAPLVLVRITKKRIPANPFGFGVKWEELSNFQLSIAAALGLSRGRR